MDALESRVEHTELAPPLDGVRASTLANAAPVGMESHVPLSVIPARPILAARMLPASIRVLGATRALVIQGIMAMEPRALVSRLIFHLFRDQSNFILFWFDSFE